MDKETTIKKIDMIRFNLRNAASELVYVGRYSDHVYQAKFEQYAEEIDVIIRELLKDEFDES